MNLMSVNHFTLWMNFSVCNGETSGGLRRGGPLKTSRKRTRVLSALPTARLSCLSRMLVNGITHLDDGPAEYLWNLATPLKSHLRANSEPSSLRHNRQDRAS